MQPAGWWAETPARRILYMTEQVLHRVERAGREDARVRYWTRRLHRAINQPVASYPWPEWWGHHRLDYEPEPPAEITAAWERVFQPVHRSATGDAGDVGALWLDAAAYRVQYQGLPFDETIWQESMAGTMHMVSGIPDTLRAGLRATMAATVADARAWQPGVGRPPTQYDFARQIRRDFAGLSRRRAELIAVTEWNRAASAATMTSYRMQGVEGKVWIAAGDDRVCPNCEANMSDGPIPLLQGFASGADMPPEHPGCRCNIASALLTGQPEAGFPSAEMYRPPGPLRGKTNGKTRPEAKALQAHLDANRSPDLRNDIMAAKNLMMRRVAGRLKGNKAWDDLIRSADSDDLRYRGAPYSADDGERIVAALTQQWAKTSGDGRAWSVAAQMAVKQEFRLARTWEGYAADAAVRADALAIIERHGDALRAFVRAQYDETQAVLREAGIDRLVVYRGMMLNHGDDFGSTVRVGSYQLQPASSFSLDYKTASSFEAGPGVTVDAVIAVEVDAAAILSTPYSGYGCLNEFEVVVLGDTIEAAAWHGTRGAVPKPGDFAKYALDKAAPPRPWLADADLLNADWPKRTWDLLIDNLPDLRANLASEGVTAAAFKLLPVYQHNVERLPWLADL